MFYNPITKTNDVVTKDKGVDVGHMADYLWTWVDGRDAAGEIFNALEDEAFSKTNDKEVAKKYILDNYQKRLNEVARALKKELDRKYNAGLNEVAKNLEMKVSWLKKK